MAALNDLSAETLDNLEAGLLADLEAVRRIRTLLGGRQPLVIPASVLAAMLPGDVSAPASVKTADTAPAPVAPPVPPPPPEAPEPAPYIPPPRHPNARVSDPRVAVRQVLEEISGTFVIGDVKKELEAGHYQQFGDTAIRSALQALQEEGLILLSARGIGRGGNKYSKPAAAIPPDGASI